MRMIWLGHFVPYPPRGGNLQRSHHLLRLAAERNEVHLVALTQRALLPTSEQMEEATEALRPWVASMTVHSIPADRSRLAWYGLVGRAFLNSRPYEELWLRQPALARALNSLERRVGPVDLIHADTIGMWQYLPHRKGLAVVLNHHNIESQLTARRAARERSRLRRLYFSHDAAKLRRLEARICPTASINLVVSALDAARLLALAPGSDVAVVDNGVDTDYFRATHTEPEVPGRLLFVASMAWYPNAAAATYLVREVWPAIKARDPDSRLVLVGPDPPADVVRAAAIDSKLTVTGFVNDVRPYFEQAEIYLCPIRDGGGTRLKVLDALAMQRPIVATALAVEGLDLTPEVHYLRAESPNEFAEQVLRLRSDPGLRRRLAEAGRCVVEATYAWPRIGERLAEAYHRARLKAAAAGAGRRV